MAKPSSYPFFNSSITTLHTKTYIQPNPFLFSSFSLESFWESVSYTPLWRLIYRNPAALWRSWRFCRHFRNSPPLFPALGYLFPQNHVLLCPDIPPFLVWCTFSRSFLKRGAWRLRLYLTETSCPLPSYLIEYWVGHHDSMSKNISSQYLGGNSPLSANYHS